MSNKKLEAHIEGMTCEHCASGIEALLKSKEGVAAAEINFSSGKGKITFKSDRITKAEIVNTINGTKKYQVKNSSLINTTSQDSDHFDLIIIGGGSSAFSAAITAHDLGLRILMVNGGLPFGGTCVNVGCVPSKILIRAGETAYHASHSNFDGISPNGAKIDFAKLIREKKDMVSGMQQKKYMDIVKDFDNLSLVEGWAEFEDHKTIVVNGEIKYTGLKFIIATGAKTNIPDIIGLQDVNYLTNVTLFVLENKPESLTIMGAGYIGLEIAMAYSRLGVKVRIMEFTDRVLRSQAPDVSQELQKHMQQEGIDFLPNVRAQRFEKNGFSTIIHCKSADGNDLTLNEPGHVIVSTGTRPNTSKLGLDKINLELTKSGHIAINNMMETSVPNIYAVGDVVNTPAYVYTAALEGKIAVENAFKGEENKVDYTAVPWVIFTDPQVAGVGIDELEAASLGLPFEVSKLPLTEVPRSQAAKDTRGFIKLIRNKENDKLLGARVVAPEGGELIMELTLALKYGISVKELAETFHPYLTLSEGIKLAAIAFGKDIAKLSCCAS